MLSTSFSKSASQSRTIQASTVGAIVSVIVLLAGLLGFDLGETELTLIVTTATTLVTSVLAILGRLRATATIV